MGGALKAYVIAQLRVYVEQRYGVSVPGLRAVLRIVGKLLCPLFLLSGKKRRRRWPISMEPVASTLGDMEMATTCLESPPRT